MQANQPYENHRPHRRRPPQLHEVAPIIDALKAAQVRGSRLTYRLIHTGQHYDRAFARRVSQIFGTDHCEVEVDLSRPEEMLDQVTCFDQPFANPTFYISRPICSTRGRGRSGWILS